MRVKDRFLVMVWVWFKFCVMVRFRVTVRV